MSEQTTRFQFQVDRRATGPVRDTWEEAARDAVQAGYAVWMTRNQQAVKLNDQADIRRLP